MKKPVLILGGGIAGIQAACDLAQSGSPVFLVEKTPSLGGRMAQLDKTFPTNDCSACILAPKVTECINHPLIKVFIKSELLELKGESPDFTAVILRKATGVDPVKCTGCGECAKVCPVKVESEFDENLCERRAIYKPYAQAAPNKFSIDRNACINCGRCEKACAAGAINRKMPDERTLLEVSAVIIANGCSVSKELTYHFGHLKYKDVITSIEYERMLSASGPFGGHVRRLSDGRAPSRIAFVQCSGSRSKCCGAPYCSSVCCMYAVKEASISREHMPKLSAIDIFYMDMRSFGKEFDKYVDSARDKYKVGFIRSRISHIERNEESGQVDIHYIDGNGMACVLPYDLAVLSVGLEAHAGSKEFWKKAGVKTDRFGFIHTSPFQPTQTTTHGIFACGSCAGPCDIPETVTQASAAAAGALVASSMKDAQGQCYFEAEEEVPERNTSKEAARIGVFVCRCGSNIGGFVDVPAVTAYARGIDKVAYASEFVFACSVDSQKVLSDICVSKRLNRVVVASCSPRTHEKLFQGALQKAGLNPSLLAMANIRDQCSWVHMNEPASATEKAKSLVKMAVSRVRFAKPLARLKIGVNKTALVLGGGVSGISAALSIADLGHCAVIVEKSGRLGGNAANLAHAHDLLPAQRRLDELILSALHHPNITVFTNARACASSGYVGNFETSLTNGKKIAHGATIIATGANERLPYEFGWNGLNVITQAELERKISSGSIAEKNIFMYQCAGSRGKERPYCSRVCCGAAVKNALIIKSISPEASITVLYRDMRTYGSGELNYQKAREAGVLFIRYEAENPPAISGSSIRFYESATGAFIESSFDLVVLASAITSNPDNSETAQLYKVPLTREGFFLEAHSKLRPVDFAVEGVYVCGLAHSPKNLKESVWQAKAAAARAMTVISKNSLEAEGMVARVNQSLCSGCARCERVCAYQAIEVKEELRRGAICRKADINPVLCKGCGTCSVACLCGAIDIDGFADRQIIAEVEALAAL
ncbi:MAG: FAD-dependent oxidoreductase [Clostridiales bacterium]|jgi:heterodisulfide reductase subunit A|nr:FAD-dependent oxidoreductase [Clostridiales bacterium]